MNINVLRKDKIRKVILPEKIYGAYSILDDEDKMLANIESVEDKWVLKANNYIEISVDGKVTKDVQLVNFFKYTIKVLVTNTVYEFIPTPTYDASAIRYTTDKKQIVISSENTADIFVQTGLEGHKIVLTKVNNYWSIENDGAQAYVNDRTFKKRNLFHGDVLFVNGLKIIVVNDDFIINNPKNAVKVSGSFTKKQEVAPSITYQKGVSEDKKFFEREDFFNKAPRFRSVRDTYKLKIVDPPHNEAKEEQAPWILSVGPAITTNFLTVFNLVMRLEDMANGKIQFRQLLPSIVAFVVSLITTYLWPFLTELYTKRKARKNKALCIKKYMNYLDEKEKEIDERIEFEKQILIENALPLSECQSIIYNKKRNLWERNITDDDFLSVRVGTGRVRSNITCDSEPNFSIDDEKIIKDRYYEVYNKYPYIDDAPMDVSLTQHRITAVVGNSVLTKYFFDSLFLQLTTFHSYRDLKIFVITNQNNDFLWEYLKVMPHCWDNLKTKRFFSNNPEDMNEIAAGLDSIFKTRLAGASDDQASVLVEDGGNVQEKYQSYDTYYLIFIDDLDMARNIPIIKEILKYKINLGFSIIIRNDKLSNLPSECKTFIDVEVETSGLFESDIKQDNQKQFKAELNKDIDMYGCAQRLANIPILAGKAKYELPASISFLTMYNVGKVEQLNSLDRWKKNNPALSLSVPVGINQDGEWFKMDAHEKAFGPHGLVAGTTGSGKSEWLITYILSLAVNFHPDEVQFVLIDYKGGGLALSFENKELGVRLPHLAGTITNLDKSAINRALTSIEAELKSRQAIFNEAREKLHESSMDIKKYQQLYRKGLVDTPVSHLFLISDEFAELKSQQPEFLDQLVSTARIGRSLGVHLILATQKPSGVVNEQIWSNSRFHVCLRVQDSSDSSAMIKTPDAAMLKTTGAFYLQVGFDEYYGLGQSAWAGAKYHPSDIVRKEIDDSVQLIDNLGNILNSYNSEVETTVDQTDHGEELLNIVSYISEISKQDHVVGKQLWLPNIPEEIFLDDIKKKYEWKPTKYDLKTVVGEYDNPVLQTQDIATLDLAENTVIYGEGGAGKENLLTTIIWSSMTEHSPEEVNFYIVDYGAETLRMFAKYPHVGEVLFEGDQERIISVLQMIGDELEKRKDLFADYNGNYESYLKESGKKLPRIVMVINGWDVFSEALAKLAGALDPMFRDAPKYGITFICATTAANMLKGRRASNFENKVCLHMPDDFDYRDLANAPKKLVPHNNFGRGVLPVNDETVCEFQTAFVTKREEINMLIRKNADNFIKYYPTKAKSLPKIPDNVTSEQLAEFISDETQVPVGYNFYEKDVARFDFTKEKVFMVAMDDMKVTMQSIYGLVNTLSKVPNTIVRVFDIAGIFEQTNPDIKYWNENYDPVLIALNNDLKKRTTSQPHGITIILGAGLLKNKLNDYGKKILAEYMDNIHLANKSTVILVDAYQRLKTLKIEPWFAKINNSYGMWIGKGIENQNILNAKDTPMEERKMNFPGMAYIIDNTDANLIKTVLDKE